MPRIAARKYVRCYDARALRCDFERRAGGVAVAAAGAADSFDSDFRRQNVTIAAATNTLE